MTTLFEHLKLWMKENRLLYIKVVKAKEGKSEIWGRLIQIDDVMSNLLIYDDDNKKLINLSMNEIEDIMPAMRK